MSPYRVLVRKHINADTEYDTIFAAMLSIDEDTKERRIFIVEKPLTLVARYDREEISRLAHQMTCKHNSTILKKYTIRKVTFTNRYYIVRKDRDGIVAVGGSRYLQSDCLKDAMIDYCNRESFHILEEL